MWLENNINNRMKELERIISEKEKALACAPEGALKIHARKGGDCYYMVMEANSDGIYLPKSEIVTARELAQKSYDQKVLASAKAELNALRHAQNFYSKKSPAEDCFGNLSQQRQKLVHPIRLTDEQFIEKWKREHPPRSEGKPRTDLKTKKGDLVRSRAEVLIADHLYMDQLIYQFETPLILGRHVFYPDFCILNLRRRKTFFWEHFGMLDDPDYLEDNMFKLNTYAKNGIIIGENLIITYETAINPFNTAQIDQLIQTFLV